MELIKDQITFFDKQGGKHLLKANEYEKKMENELQEVERYALFSRALCRHLKYIRGGTEE